MTFCDIIFRKYNLYNQKHLVSLKILYSFCKRFIAVSEKTKQPSLPFLKNNDSSDKIRSTFQSPQDGAAVLSGKNDSKKEGSMSLFFPTKMPCEQSKSNYTFFHSIDWFTIFYFFPKVVQLFMFKADVVGIR